MGIGGLDEEFSFILRRAFTSRLFPREVIKQMGIKHVKGIPNSPNSPYSPNSPNSPRDT